MTDFARLSDAFGQQRLDYVLVGGLAVISPKPPPGGRLLDLEASRKLGSK